MMKSTFRFILRPNFRAFFTATVFVALVTVQSCQAGVITSNLTPGSTGTGVIGIGHIGQIVHFTNPGTYEVTSIDAKLAFTNTLHSNVSAVVTLFSSPDQNNATNVFSNQVAQHTFQLGNLTGTPGLQIFHFDFAGLNLMPQATDSLGITIRLLQNGVPHGSLGFGLTFSSNPLMAIDDDQNGQFSSSEIGLLSGFDSQMQVNGNFVAAVPEPSSLAICGVLGLIVGLKRKPRDLTSI